MAWHGQVKHLVNQLNLMLLKFHMHQQVFLVKTRSNHRLISRLIKDLEIKVLTSLWRPKTMMTCNSPLLIQACQSMMAPWNSYPIVWQICLLGYRTSKILSYMKNQLELPLGRTKDSRQECQCLQHLTQYDLLKHKEVAVSVLFTHLLMTMSMSQASRKNQQQKTRRKKALL